MPKKPFRSCCSLVWPTKPASLKGTNLILGFFVFKKLIFYITYPLSLVHYLDHLVNIFLMSFPRPPHSNTLPKMTGDVGITLAPNHKVTSLNFLKSCSKTSNVAYKVQVHNFAKWKESHLPFIS